MPEGREQARVAVLREHALGFRQAEQVHVLARLLLRRVVLQLAPENVRMRRVDHDQALEPPGMADRHVPGHRPAPVVAYEDELAARVVRAEREHVGHQVLRLVGLHAPGLVRQVVAAQVGRHREPAARRKMLHRPAPRAPELGKAVQEEHHRASGVAHDGAMQVDAAAVVPLVADPGIHSQRSRTGAAGGLVLNWARSPASSFSIRGCASALRRSAPFGSIRSSSPATAW